MPSPPWRVRPSAPDAGPRRHGQRDRSVRWLAYRRARRSACPAAAHRAGHRLGLAGPLKAPEGAEKQHEEDDGDQRDGENLPPRLQDPAEAQIPGGKRAQHQRPDGPEHARRPLGGPAPSGSTSPPARCRAGPFGPGSARSAMLSPVGAGGGSWCPNHSSQWGMVSREIISSKEGRARTTANDPRSPESPGSGAGNCIPSSSPRHRRRPSGRRPDRPPRLAAWGAGGRRCRRSRSRRADDIDGAPFGARHRFADRHDIVPRVVHGGPDQVVHRRIQDQEVAPLAFP